MVPRTPAKLTSGRASCGGFRPRPVILISPPGREAAGWMASMKGLPFTFLRPRNVSEMPMRLRSLSRYEVPEDLQQDQRVESGAHIVHHESGPGVQLFQAAQRERLRDV